MKWICLLLSFVFSVTAYAQQGTLKGNIDVKNFPEVSFIWNEYNPDVLSSNQFTIKENGKEARFTSQNLLADSIPLKNKSILFLWEYQPGKKSFFNFVPSLLLNFILNDVNDETSTFNISIFNQKQGPKLEGFTSDKEKLETFISGWSDEKYAKEHGFQDNSDKSALLTSIREGLDLTGKEPKDNARAIVVISSGQFTDGEKLQIINLSLKNKIPVYIIHYPTSVEENESLAQLSKDTYGQFVSTNVSDSAQTRLRQWFNGINRRHYGQDYKISFTSLAKRDGKEQHIVVNENFPINYNAPDFSLFVWAKKHLILFLILSFILLSAATLGIFFGVRFFKEKRYDIKEQKQEEEQRKARQQAEQEALKRKLNETQENLKRQQKAAEQEKQQIQEQEHKEQLAKLMRAKNLQARLLAVNNNEIFNISDVTSTIGRNGDNDIVIADGTVSKYHAQIVFNGSGFEICDLQSSNGIIVNGQYIENSELKNGDIIQLGETVIKFYI